MLSELEQHYRALVEHNYVIGEICMTWCRAASSDAVIGALGVEMLEVTTTTLPDVAQRTHDDLTRGELGGLLLLADEAPWFLAMECAGDRAFQRLEQLSVGGEAVCLIGSQTLYRFALFYARDGRLLCKVSYGDDIWGDTTAIDEHLRGLAYLHERFVEGESSPGAGLLEDWRVHALALLERITGVRLTFEFLAQRRQLYRFQL